MFYLLSYPIMPGDITVVLPIALCLITFVIYWFTAHSSGIKEAFYNRYDFDTASLRHIFFTKVVGFVVMGVLPLIVCLLVIPEYTLADYGVGYQESTLVTTLLWIIGLSLLVIPLSSFSARKPKNLINYPQIRAKRWTTSTVVAATIGWSIYLFGYELLFRGILLIPLAETIGVWPAITINIALYSATHIPKGLEETIGAIPLGLVLCLLTLNTGTIWIAFFVHLAMALTNCFTALKFHPDITYQKKGVL